ncbi:choice-of-anchor D domain-containing protein, partial [Candidatus Latescibacterota bacterium]
MSPAEPGWRRLGLPMPPVEGMYYRITLDPQYPDTIYAAGSDNQGGSWIYRSADGGDIWSEVSRPPRGFDDYAQIHDVAVDPANSHKIYTGGLDGVHQSLDGGITWSHLFSDEPVDRVVVDPQTPSHLFTSPMHGGNVYRSEDSGGTWKAVSGVSLGMQGDIIFGPEPSDRVYAIGGGGWKSEDSGVTWEPFAEDIVSSEDPGHIGDLAVHPTDPDVVYMGVGNNATGLYKSMDGGMMWMVFPLFNGKYVRAIAVDPTDPNVMYVSATGPGAFVAEMEKGVYRTSDGGMNWEETGMSGSFTGMLLLDAEAGRLYASTTDGVYVYESGGRPTPEVAEISLSATTLAFGDVEVGSSSSRTLTLANVGTASVEVTARVGEGTPFGVSPQSLSLAPGDRQELTVTFRSEAEGSFGTTLQIDTDAPEVGTLSVPVSATAVTEAVPRIAVSANPLDFESVVFGQPAALVLTVSNQGSAALTVDRVSVSDAVLATADTGFSVAPGGEHELTVILQPTTLGPYSGTVTVFNDDPQTPQLVVAVQAEVVSPAAPVLLAPADGAAGVPLDVSLQWYAAASAGAYQIQVGEDEAVTSLVLDAAARTDTVIGVETLAEGTAYYWRVRSEYPGGTGAWSEVWSFTTVVPSAPMPQIAVSADPLDFGDVELGQGRELTLTVSNHGAGVLHVDSVAVSDAGVAVMDTGFVVSPGGEHLLTVTLQPMALGAYTGAITVFGDDAQTPQLVVVVRAAVTTPPDVTAPGPPIDMVANAPEAGAWSIDNSITLSWIDPADESGVAIAHYKIGDPPTSASDTTGMTAAEGSLTITLAAEGEHSVYVWLEDGVGNFDHTLLASVTVRYDATAPFLSTTPVTDQALGRDLRVEVEVSDVAPIDSVALHYRTGGSDGFVLIPMAAETGDRFAATIAGADIGLRGLEYFLTARDPAGNVATFPAEGELNPVRVRSRFQDYVADTPLVAGIWLMISVPVEPANGSPYEVLAALGTYDDTQWRCFRYYGGSFKELNETDIGDFLPGRAFWLKNRREGIRMRCGTGQTTPLDSPYQITLEPGWNDIATPYAFAVAWDDVMAASGDPAGIAGPYQYDGASWSFPQPTDQMVPWNGYAVKNPGSSSVVLDVPTIAATGSPKEIGSSALDDASWVLRIEATSGQVRDIHNYLGFRGDASSTWDPYDLPEPPLAPGAHVTVSFPHDDWTRFPGKYTSDFRPPSPGEAWDFVVHGSSDTPMAVLSFEGVDRLPAGMSAHLLDMDGGVALDLADGRQLSLSLGNGRRFRVAVGSAAYLEEASRDFRSAPQTYELRPNHPNPFNSSTVMS